MRTWVTVEVQAWGEHRWPGAPEPRSYLGSPHRHRFHVEHSVQVVEDDREVEFHDLHDLVVEALRVIGNPDRFGWHDFGTWSCEQIAVKLCEHVEALVGANGQRCKVSEDGINGAEVEYP